MAHAILGKTHDGKNATVSTRVQDAPFFPMFGPKLAVCHVHGSELFQENVYANFPGDKNKTPQVLFSVVARVTI